MKKAKPHSKSIWKKTEWDFFGYIRADPKSSL